MYSVAFTLTGEMPLLMHRDYIEGADRLAEWRGDPQNKNHSSKGDDRSPPWTWHSYLYHDGRHVTIPTDNLMSALLVGAVNVILRKQKTYKEMSQSAILIESEHLRFEYGPDRRQLDLAAINDLQDLPFSEQAAACRRLGFSLFCKRVRIGQAKHIRVRPKFDQWHASGRLSVHHADLPFDRLQLIFHHAGRAGLCDWRPSSPKRPGPYGMFSAQLTLEK